MIEVVSPQFVYRRVRVADTDALFDRIGADLHAAGRVRPTFVDGLKSRESRYPTGIPVSGGVAIPHTDAEHVLHDTIAVATLAEPVSFGSMGGGDQDVAVATVFLLALHDPSQHMTFLPRVVKGLQDEAFVQELHAAGAVEEIAERVAHAFASAEGLR
ncbi:MAG: PTS sugar transporter subunit IIA [Propioniciclava sp.]